MLRCGLHSGCKLTRLRLDVLVVCRVSCAVCRVPCCVHLGPPGECVLNVCGHVCLWCVNMNEQVCGCLTSLSITKRGVTALRTRATTHSPPSLTSPNSGSASMSRILPTRASALACVSLCNPVPTRFNYLLPRLQLTRTCDWGVHWRCYMLLDVC